MSSKIKYSLVSVFVVFCAVVFFYLTGCCSKGGGSGFAVNNVGGNHQPEAKLFDVKVNEDGSITKTLAPSGRLSIEAPENTLNKDVVVHMVENQAVGNESDIYSIGKYIYAIKPDREEKDENIISIGANAKRDVKIQTSPIILTFSDDERLTGAENYYIGIKEIGGKDWQFANVYSATNPQIKSNGPTGSFEYKLYKDNVLLALFADFNKNIGDKPKVLSMIASMPDNIIDILDGRYKEDAVIKLKFIGDNLSRLRADDYRIRLHYANTDSSQVNIRIDGKTANYTSGTSTNKYEAFGELYAHYYEFIPSAASYSAGVTPELSFSINFKDFPLEDFANDFVIEAFKNSENVLPFNCFAKLHFDTKEKEPEPEPQPQPQPEPQSEPEPEPIVEPQNITFVVASNSTNIIDSERGLYCLKPLFTITASPSFAFSDEEKAAIASAVTVIGADDSVLTKTWNNGSFVLTFNTNLTSNTEYTVKTNEINNLERIHIKPVDLFVFKTTDDYYIALTPDNDNVYDVENSLYHCRPGFTIISNITLDEADKEKIAKAVSVSNVAPENIVKEWNNEGSLRITFNQNLSCNTEYILSMSGVNDIKGVSVIAFNDFSFTTINNLVLTLTPDADNVYAAMSPLYHCKPGFSVVPNIKLKDDDKTSIANAITLSGANLANIVKEWNNEGSLRITFSQNLNTGTVHTLSMAAVNDIKGVDVTPFDPLNFTTVDSLTFTVIPDNDNLFDVPNNICHCRPEFTITPSISLNDADKTKISNAATISSNDNLLSKNWNGNDLKIAFNSKLATDTVYNLNMAAINDMTGIPVVPFDVVSFKTMPAISVTIVSEDSNIIDVPNNLYHCRPQFTINPGYDADDDAKAIIASAVTVIGADENNITKNWVNGSLVIGFISNLTTSTEYRVSIDDIGPSFDKLVFSLFEPLTFTTTGDSYVAIVPDEGNVFISSPTELYHCRPTFAVTPSVALSDSDRTTIANAIHVSNIDDNNLTKDWNASGSLILGFSQNLALDTEYTVSIDPIGEISGVNLILFQPLTFRTVPALNLAIASVASNTFVTTPSTLYHCRPSFILTSSLDLGTEDKAKIAAAIRVTNVNDENITREWDNAGNLLISFNQNLSLNTDYTLSMVDVTNITGVTVNSFAPLAFTTMGAITFTATPDDSNVYTAMNPKYHCKPAFTITPNYSLAALSEASRTALLDAVTISNSSGVTKAWDGNNIRVTCSTNLAANAHSLSMSEVDFTGITVTPFANLDFSVLDTLTFTVTPDAGNVYTALSPKYNCRPSHTITTSFTLNEEDKTKIKNAISVSNTESIIHKEWQGNSLVITFSENLTSNTAYTLSMESVSGMPNVNITNFSNQTFTTIPQLTFNITSANTNVFYDGRYHCNPTFTITPNFAIDSSYNSAIEGAVSVSGVSPSNVSKTWNGNNLLLGFNNYIATNTDYTISMSDINSLTGVNVTSLADFDFTTIPELVVRIATISASIVKQSNGISNLAVNGNTYLYCGGSNYYTVSTNMTLNSANKTKLLEAISVSNIDSSLVNKSLNGNYITIGFNDDLTASTSYTVSMSDITDINGVTVKPFQTFAFTSFFHQGKGTQAAPFTIYTPAQLACLDLYSSQAYDYKQMEDLDLSGYANWMPIASSTYGFKGKYNGNNKTISGAKINYPNDSRIGLFAKTSSANFNNLTLENISVIGKGETGAFIGYSYNDTMKNITVNNINASGSDSGFGGVYGRVTQSNIENNYCNNIKVESTGSFVGIVVGFSNKCTISDCSVSNSSITGASNVGGFLGESYSDSVLTNVICDNVTVNGTSRLGGFEGYCINSTKDNCSVINSHIGSNSSTFCGGFIGLLGDNYKDVTRNCTVRNTEIRAANYAGGFAAYYYVSDDNSNQITDCFVYDSTVSGADYTGGFIGSNKNAFGGGISNSGVENTTITSTGSVVGGFIGSSTCSLTSCYVASISMDTSGNYIGGLAGYASGNITSCYSDDAKIKGRLHSVGGLVGYLSPIGNVNNCYVSKANIKVDDASQNRQCYGGLVGQSAGTISKSYVVQSSIDSCQQIGGLVGYTTAGSISKCFVKDTTVKGYDFCVGGITAALFSQAQLDSCYVKSSNISFTVTAYSNNHTIGGLVGSNTANITNCYLYNSTVSGKTNYGALIGSNEGSGSITNCFISNNYSILIDNNVNSTPLTYCFYNVNDLSTFNGKSWSAGAWSNFNTTSFPPQLTEVAEP